MYVFVAFGNCLVFLECLILKTIGFLTFAGFCDGIFSHVVRMISERTNANYFVKLKLLN